LLGGVQVPLAPVHVGLIDENDCIVQPRLAGHGPTLFARRSEDVELAFVDRYAFGSGAVSMGWTQSR